MGHSLPILRQGVGLRISARRQAPLGRGSRDRRTSARPLPLCADGAPNCGQVICNVRQNKSRIASAEKAMGDPPPRRPHRRLRTRGRGSPLARAGNRGSLRYGRRRCRAEVFRRAQAGAAAPPSLPRARRRRSQHAATATGVQRLVYLLVANKPFWHGKEISARRYRRYARCWRLPRAT